MSGARPRFFFLYPIFIAYIDLGKLGAILKRSWLWGLNRPALVSFYRSDYHGDPNTELDDAVRKTVFKKTGKNLTGPIRLLSHLRYFGYCFNPVSFYYCFDKDDKEVELIFVNNNVIFLENKKGISVNGNGEIIIEFYSNIPKMIKEVEWEENKFDVEIIANSEIENFNFDQTSKSISFEVTEVNEYVTISMSEELLGGPYVILLDTEKIGFSKSEIGEYVTLSMKPETTGQVTIIGTTVIPEFSMFIPLIMGFLIILTVPAMRKFSLR